MSAKREPMGLSPALRAAVDVTLRETRDPAAYFVTLCALMSHVRTLEGECFPEELCDPKYESVGIDVESLVAILGDFEAWGYLRVGPQRRFFLCREFAAEMVQARRSAVRDELRLVEGGRA
jgi:hypothetical protein